MDIFDFLGKKVRIIDSDNIERIGFVSSCTTAEDDPDNKISIDVVFADKSINLFYEEDIKSIEEIKQGHSKSSLKKFKYEPSRHIMDFHIAGFTYYEGIDVIDELSLGVSVDLFAESDNPYDPESIAIYYKNKKIGYVPKDKNSLISKYLYFGHNEIFESKIQYVNKEEHPERQIRVVLKIKDNR
ncbi:HIRAN domain-containing protein [Gemelliphila palaticanis]|nr:HIRAN domain-containing protein [Gemella palaticanis]